MPSVRSGSPPAGTRAIIEIANLHTRIGAQTIHENINLSVRRGEIIVLTGGSGSGKSTLLREIVLLQRPTSGSIRVFGKEITRMSDAAALEIRRQCGFMFQQGALFGSLTVAENVAFPLLEHTDLSQELIREIVPAKIRLAKLPLSSGAKYPSQLSGGMRKRAALARAIALDPELLLLDEPTAGLDPESAAALDELLKDLREHLGLTVVLVTHDLDTIWAVADRVAVLGRGTLLAVGTLDELSKVDDPLVRVYFEGPRARAAREQAWNQK